MATRRPPGAMPLDDDDGGPWPARDAGPRRPRAPGALPLDPLPRPVPATSLGRRPTDPSITLGDIPDDDGESDSGDGDGDGASARGAWDELGPTESFTPPPLTTPAVNAWDDLGPTESLTLPVSSSSTSEASTSSSARPTPPPVRDKRRP
jgi:hypothetical protein